MPLFIKTTKSKWSRKGVHGIRDVVKCQCCLFQCGDAMIKYNNFQNYYCVSSLVLYPFQRRGQECLHHKACCLFISHYRFAVDSPTLWGKHGCFVSCCLFGSFLCIVCSCDCHITVVICVPEQEMHVCLLLNYIVEMNGDLLSAQVLEDGEHKSCVSSYCKWGERNLL